MFFFYFILMPLQLTLSCLCNVITFNDTTSLIDENIIRRCYKSLHLQLTSPMVSDVSPYNDIIISIATQMHCSSNV